MTFQVMHAEHGLVQRSGHGTGGTRSHQQGSGKAGTARESNHIHVVELFSRIGQHSLGQRQHAADMVATGQLRHHAAISLVHFNLAVQGMAEQGGYALSIRHSHQGHAGFIAGGFDSEDQQTHGAQV